MKQQNETWSEYFANKNVRPKTFNVTFRRNSDGAFEIVGHNAFMEHNKGRSSEWIRVDARDLARTLRNSGIIVK